MEKVRIGLIGYGGRGQGLTRVMLTFDEILITAVCDVYEDRCQMAYDKIVGAGQPAPFVTTDYHQVLERDDVDAIVIATSWESHGYIAVDALKSGKPTGLEVGSVESIDECWELVDTYEATKTPFMFLENCCFGKNELFVRNMARAGMFGELVHCHGAYRHDLRYEVAGGKEKRHYRLKHYLTRNCENYPTHELGPIAKILGINRGNRMVSLVSVASKARGVKQYIDDRKETFPNKDIIGVDFKQGDIVNTIITCANGETISIKLDTTLPCPGSRELTIRGTKGMFEADTNSVWFDGQKEAGGIEHYKKAIDNATEYYDKFLPAKWKNITPEQVAAGHGGMDIFEFETFIDCVKNNKPMPIDVYDAASWMCITALSEESIKRGNMPMEIPDFTRGAWKDRPPMDIELDEE